MLKKIFIALAFMLALAVSFSGMNSRAAAHYAPNFHANFTAAEFDDYSFVNLSGKKKFRCKICGRTFGLGILVAGHIKGEHNKFLIHKYYEKI